MLHIPILRKGRPYRSLDVITAVHHRTREPFVEISQANAGLIRRDLLDQRAMKESLDRLSARDLSRISRQAAGQFFEATLPLGGSLQSPEDYVRQVSATTGLPHALARKNMEKIRSVLTRIEDVVSGLTRGLDLAVLDTGYTDTSGLDLSFYPRGDSLGIVLPSNSPGVHSLWVPAIALKMPLVLKPGAAEPWTPYRIIQAFVLAGCPEEAFGYYPTDHSGAGEILRGCGRGMLFGDVSSTAKWKGDSRIELHGPGYSKIVIGEDRINDWEKYLDVMVASILENGGRSCVNASGIWVPSHASEIAQALAERLATVEPRAADDPEALLAPFADPNVATRISQSIDQALVEPGAQDVTASIRNADRLAFRENCAYLLPTIVLCESRNHPLANREFLFPFASVVEAPVGELPEAMGPTLVVTAITDDQNFIRRLVSSSLVDRLNLGPVATNKVAWDQPHEGNLFEHLYARRAFQQAVAGGQ